MYFLLLILHFYIQLMNNLRQENIYNLNLFDDDVSVNEDTIIKSKNNKKKYYFKVSEQDDYRKWNKLIFNAIINNDTHIYNIVRCECAYM